MMTSIKFSNGLSSTAIAWSLKSWALVGVVLAFHWGTSSSARADETPSVRAQSDDSMENVPLDDEEVEEEPDPFRRRTPVRPHVKKKEESTSNWFTVPSSSGDGPGMIGQAGHLAFKTFGRNESITPLEAMPYVLADEHFFFSDLRGFVSNNAQFGGNVGLGYRNLRDDLNSWFGGSVWYDADGTSGRTFQQIGLSFEAMIERFELRSNVYIPVTSSQSFSNTITNPRLVGNQLLYGQFIDQGKALTGVDFEAGYNLPVMEPHRLRAFVGYYRFDGAPNGAVNGFKARLEGVINNTVTAQVMYTNDPLFGSNVMVGCQFQFPFGQSHPSSNWRQNTPTPFRFVERNYNVIVAHQQTTNGSVVAINPATNNPYNVEQVSSTGGAGGNGSTAQPYSTVAAAQGAGADVILVQGNSVLNSQVNLTPGQSLIGQGSTTYLPLAGGRVVQLPNLIAAAQTPSFANINGDAVTMSSNNVISGFKFSNIIGNAITGNNVTNATIQNVSFDHINGDAVHLSNSSGNVKVNNFTVTSATGDGFRFDGGSANLTFSGSVSGTQGNGIALSNLSGGVIQINNATVAATNGAGLSLDSVGTNVTVTSLSTSGTTGPAISITGGGSGYLYDFSKTTTIQSPNGIGLSVTGSQANVTFDNLAIASTVGSNAVSLSNSSGRIIFTDLTIDSSNGTGLSADNVSSLTVSNGNIATVNGSAIDVQASTINMTLSSVSTNHGPYGIQLAQDVGVFNIVGNNAYGTGGMIQNTTTGVILNTAGTVNINWLDMNSNGVGIQSQNTSQVNLTGLRIANSTGYAFDSMNDAVVELQNSQFSGNGAVGGGTIRQQVGNSTASYQWLIQGNTISDANGTAIQMATQPSSSGPSLAATVQQNTITGNAGGNSLINIAWNGPLSALVSTNNMTAVGSNMTGVNIQDTSTVSSANVRVTTNTMAFTNNEGTGVMVTDAGSNSLQIDTNTITFGGVQGIGLHFNLTGTSTTWIYSNNITDNAGGATGMLFDNVAANSRLQIESNTITLLSTDLSVRRGIIFTNVTPTIQFVSHYNNVISNTPTPFSIPVNSSTGQILVNGTLVP